MENKFFPNETEELNRVMEIYEQEILNRKEWINESVKRYNEARDGNGGASIIINYAMSIINHAMVIVRILDKEAISSRKHDKKRSKERANILHERNPGLPDPPEKLRRIRNDYEHFEEKIDVWATSSKSNVYIDLGVISPGAVIYSEAKENEIFRQIEGYELTFWNNRVNLQEVIQWVSAVSDIVNEEQHQF